MGQTPAKGFMPSAPYGSSPAANTLNQTNPGGVNPQIPLLPPGFQDPGTMQKAAAIPATPTLGGSAGLRSPISRFYGNL